jgi:hypothetical protein
LRSEPGRQAIIDAALALSVLGKNHARNQHGLRKDLEDWLPELESLPVPTGRQLMPSLH